MPSAPSATALANAAIVFSGASAPPPRCAKTSGRDDSKKACIQYVIESPYGGHYPYVGGTPAGATAFAAGQAGNSRQPRAQARGRRIALSRHHRIRRHGGAAARQRHSVE